MRRLFGLSCLVAVFAALSCTRATAQTPNPAASASQAPSASNAQMVTMLEAALAQAPSDFSAIRGVVKTPGSFSQVWTVTDQFQAICQKCPTKILQGLPGPNGFLQPAYDFETGMTLATGRDPAASLQFVRENFLSWIPSSFAISSDPAQNGTIDPGGHFRLRFDGPNRVSVFIESYPTNYQNSGTQGFLTFDVHHAD
jgi:hypothetical protein